MQKYKQTALILALLTLVLTASVTSAYAKDEEYSLEANINGRAEKRQMILESFEENDFESWQKIVGKSNLTRVIDREKFEQFTKARDLARSGQYNESFELSYRLGVDLKSEIDKLIETDKKELALLKEARDLIIK